MAAVAGLASAACVAEGSAVPPDHTAEVSALAAVCVSVRSRSVKLSKAEAVATIAPTVAPAAARTPDQPADFAAFVELVERHGKQLLGVHLRDHVGLVRFEPETLVTIEPYDGGKAPVVP